LLAPAQERLFEFGGQIKTADKTEITRSKQTREATVVDGS